MIDERELFDRSFDRYRPPERSFDRLLTRRDRKRRNERLAAGAVALLLAIAAIGGAVSVFQSAGRERPGAPGITPQNVSDLSLAWTGAVPRITGGVKGLFARDGSVFTANAGAVYRFDENCGTGGTSCEPTGIGYGSGVAPTVDGGVLYSAADEVVAIPAFCRNDCSPIWTAPRAEGSYGASQPVVADGLVLVPWQSGVYAYRVGCASGGSACLPTSVAQDPAHAPYKVGGAHSFYPKAWVAGHTVIVDSVVRGSAFGFSTACLREHPVCKPTWSVPSGGGYVLSTGGEQLVFVATSGKLLAFDDACERSCSPVWTAELPGSIEGPPVVADGSVFIASEGELLAFSSSCGSGGARCDPTWTAVAAPAETSALFQPRMAAAEGVLVLGTRFAGDLRAFAVSCSGTCDPLWTAPGQYTRPVVSDGVVFAIAEDEHHVVAFNASCATDGSECSPLWTGSTHGFIRTPPVVDGGGVYVGTGDSKVVAFRLGAAGTAGSGSPVPITTVLAALALLAAGAGAIGFRRRARARTRETL